MKIIEEKGKIILKDIIDFDPVHTFMCGQCFRWDEEDDGFIGIAKGKVIFVKLLKNGDVEIHNTTKKEFGEIWQDYFDFNTDYKQIKNTLCNDEHLKKAIDFGYGIRILNQDVFECLISFIISTQNSIPRIKKIIANMSSLFGEEILYNGKKYYSFPTPERLASLTEEDLAPLKVGYRAKYILDAAQKVQSGEVDIYSLFDYDTKKAREELLKIKGVGPKVADCILLFSLKKHDAFPIDVWIGRIMRILYLDENATMKEILKYSEEKFSDFAGFAQQYLFYYARENKLIG
ncbi:MAG: DNA-3-methyladenine glycosylase 2 family protein [Ruminococcaceae bacterium]|nr:DNA-3-methyladenine glycosylase 2 family protein [Oscillospiraceae bacterium]